MKKTIFEILKSIREEKKLKIREVAAATSIDQGLLSKFENGERMPTKAQLKAMSDFYHADYEELLVSWLSTRIYHLVAEEEEFALTALSVAEKLVQYRKSERENYNELFSEKLKRLDVLKNKLDELRKKDSYRIVEALELEYTHASNQIEGNTLTLKETDLVVNEGLTISGKTLREHLEAINHHEAILYIKEIIANGILSINERLLLDIHHIILRNIDRKNAGCYRIVQVYIKGSQHVPPQPFLVPKMMEDYFIWYEKNKNKLHPVVLAAEMHERLVTVHPFIDGNGRTARLLMNLILLSKGYVIANIKGNTESRMKYYNALEKAQVENDKKDFIEFIIDVELECLERYISILIS